jgi:glycine dehydrogenase subunit 1
MKIIGKNNMRYIPVTGTEQKEMLREIDMSSIEALFGVIPDDFRLKRLLDLPEPLSEMDLKKHLHKLSSLNCNDTEYTSYIGEITTRHYIPAIVKSLAFLPQFYTAYTPYQPEVSQGTLQAIYEFQSLMTNLTQMDLTNASMYDGATSTAEAMLMLCLHHRKNKVLVSSLVHPAVSSVLNSYAANKDIELITIPADEGSTNLAELERLLQEDIACVIVQSPNVFGIIEDFSLISDAISRFQKISLCAVTLEPLAMALINPPAQYGAHVTTGEAQSFGIDPSFGGPGLGFFSTKKEFLRKIPGRIVGKTTDDQQRTAYVMTLRAREQDIRREKASSNICTNHALCALQATIYLTAMGEMGLKKLAQWNMHISHYAMEKLSRISGLAIPYRKPFFNEFVVELDTEIAKITPILQQKKILISNSNIGKFYPYLKNPLLLNFTELNTIAEVDILAESLQEALK